MRLELDDDQWDAVASGAIKGPDGRRYQRRSTRMRRRQVDDFLTAGTPLVMYWFSGRQLDWLDGEDAATAWQTARQRLTTSVPRPDGDVIWTAGEWGCDDRALGLLTGRC